MSALATWAERARIAASACLLVSAGLFTYHAAMAASRGADARTLRVGGPPGTMEEPQRPLRVARDEPAAPLTATEPTAGTGVLMQLLVDTTNAPGADVVVDAVAVGRAPWAGDVSCTVGDDVRVRIERGGFATHVERVRCAPGLPMRVEATLRRLRVR